MRSLLVLVVVGVLVLVAWLGCSDRIAEPPTDGGGGGGHASSASADADASAGASRPAQVPGGDLDREAAAPRTGFRVRVVDPGGVGEPRRLRVWRQDRRALAEAGVAEFDAAGQAVVAVPEGAYRFSMEGRGAVREASKRRYRVRDGELRELALRLSAPCTITGRVLDAAGQPLPGATIEVPDWDAGRVAGGDPWWRTQSDLSGRFSIAHLAAGAQSLRFRHAQHAELDGDSHTLFAGRSTDIGDVRMSKGATLRGRVVDGNGQALPDATVELFGAGRSVGVDETGRFELGRVPARAELRVVCEGFQDGRITIGPSLRYRVGQQTWADLSAPRDIVLARSMRVAGKVTGGHGPARVVVHSYALGTCWQTEPEVAEDGSFVADRLHAGRTEIQARVPGVGYSELVRLEVDGRDHEVELAVRPTRSLTVAVRDDLGAPVAEAEVTIDGSTEDLVFPCIFNTFTNKESRSTDEQGEVTFGGVLDGRWHVHVAAAGHLPKKVDLHLGHDLERTEVRVQRAGRLQVAVRGVPLEREAEFAVYHRQGTHDPVALRLRDAAFGVDLTPGEYEVYLGQRNYRKTMLGDRFTSMPAQTVQVVAGATARCDIDYREAPQVRGRLMLPPWVEGPVVVYALSPESWRERCEHAYFLDFNLGLYGRRADCARDGSFAFPLGEPGTWFFAVTLPSTSIPVPLGERKLQGGADLQFDLPRGVLCGHLDPGFRRADGSWPKVLLEPAFLARHDPHYLLEAGMGASSPLEMFGRQPAADGSFVIGPLAPGTWTMQIHEQRRLVFARQVEVAGSPIELGVVVPPGVGELTIAVAPREPGRHAVLRPAGSMVGSGAFLLRTSDAGGVLEFGAVPFGDYLLDVSEGLHYDGSLDLFDGLGTKPVRGGIEIRHRPTGVEPGSVRYPGK